MDAEAIIDRLMAHLGIQRNRDLAEYLGVASSTISTWKKRKSLDLELILSHVKDVDLNWLINGVEGPSLGHSSSIPIRQFVNRKRLGKSLPVVLVPESASAGYLTGFVDENNSDLPVVNFAGYEDGERYRLFPILGDSMLPIIQSGDLALCEKITSSHSDVDGLICIICTDEGIICKRVSVIKSELNLVSENNNFPSKTLPRKQVRELWKLLWISRKIQ